MRPDSTWAGSWLTLAAGMLLLCHNALVMADSGRKWGVAPYLGMHSPKLGVLNKGALHAPFVVAGDVLQPDDSTVTAVRTLNSDLPTIDSGAYAGLEFHLNLNDRHALFLGMGSWEGSSAGVSVGEFPLQGTVNDVIYDRKVNISYTDFFLGWKHRVYQRGNVRLFTRFSLHELFDFDYRDENVLLFTEGTAQGFRRIFRSESHSTGVLMLQPAISAEYFVRDWWSVGFDIGYQFGIEKFVPTLHGTDSDFIEGTDGVTVNISSFNPPVGNIGGLAQYKSGGNLCTQATGATCYRNLEIDLDGWKAGLRVSIYY